MNCACAPRNARAPISTHTPVLTHSAVSRVQVALGRPKAAMRSWRSVLNVNPGAASAYYSIGKIHFNAKQLAQAVSSHKTALALAPEFAYVHNDIGNALSDQSGRRTEVH